jgi:Ni,Fe-hydrogenase III large subunit
MVIEALAGVKAPLAANKLRGIALEFERLANHVGDLGALCNDVGYLPGASWFGRLRGEFLNMLLQISGNRFGRGLQKPGGVRYALSDAKREALLHRLIQVENDLQATAKTALDAASVQSRFEGTGKISRPLAVELGLVGPVARASGCERDVRCDHPNDFYRLAHIQVAKHDAGDVMARAQVRWLEAQQSIRFIRDQLAKWPEEPLSNPVKNLLPNQLALALVEGWRGEILHLALTGKHGEMLAYKIVDPSFHNWFGLALALRYNQISDFPLCNKSFNLSYAGHDL